MLHAAENATTKESADIMHIMPCPGKECEDTDISVGRTFTRTGFNTSIPTPRVGSTAASDWSGSMHASRLI